jgi:multisubunit Na+/H+ antiporter MnhB subunit
MHPRVVRRCLIAVCAAGIAGMIVTSIADSPGGALTFGLLTAVAALGMILVTAVTNGGSAREDDELGETIEDHVRRLVEAGAEEREVRALLREAMRLGSRRPA